MLSGAYAFNFFDSGVSKSCFLGSNYPRHEVSSYLSVYFDQSMFTGKALNMTIYPKSYTVLCSDRGKNFEPKIGKFLPLNYGGVNKNALWVLSYHFRIN